MKELITIITPTYNRAKELSLLYDSLCNQTDYNFIWLIVDDGSKDNTKEYIDSIISNSNFQILYYYKENGGKHTALNLAFKKVKTQLFCIVDSDDLLIPNALQYINEFYNKYKKENIYGYVFLKGYSNDKPTTDYFYKEEFIGDYIKDVINKQKHGDRFEVFYSILLKDNEFPVFKDEKFIGEGFFWNHISKGKKIVFINKILYLCDYLPNGLTKQGRKMRINNSMGGMAHAIEYHNKCYSLKIRIKNMILYHTYYFFAKKQGKNPIIISNSLLKIICFIPGLVLYLYWNKKYI